MLDTNELLRISRDFHRNEINLSGIDLRNDEPRKICYQANDVNLSKVADIAGWYKFWQQAPVEETQKKDLILAYVNGLDSLLWLAQVEQWMHLVVLEDTEVIKIMHFPRGKLNQHYLGLKTMLWNCYLRHSQDDYKHLLRSYLKLGLVEFNFTPTEIMNAFRQRFA